MSQATAPRVINAPSRTKRFIRALKRFWPLYLMMVPGILFYVVYKYAPFYGLQIAFKNFKVRKGITESKWYDPWWFWFARFWQSPSSRQVVANTLIISLSKMVIGMLPPLIFALAVNECRFRGYARVIQTVSYLPHFLSWVIVYGIATAMFNEGSGVINRLIRQMGGTPIPFLTSNKYARAMLVGTDLWHSIGWSSIVYLAAIMGIDTAMYEAARIDGAGRFRQIWYITLPNLGRIFVVLLITKVGNILDGGFNQVYVFMNERVRTSIEIIDSWVYTEGLGKMQYELATAVGLMKSVISAIMVLGTNALARKWDSALW